MQLRKIPLAPRMTTGLRRETTFDNFGNSRHDYYWADEGPFPSITAFLKVIDKPAVVGWAKKITAEAAVRNLDLVYRMTAEGGEQAGVDFLKKLADHKRDKAADMGSRVHALAEAIARKQPVEITADEAPYVNAYLLFEHEWRPRYIAAEYMVLSLKHGYGGTGDLVVELDGKRWRLDTKTTQVDGTGKINGPYPETGMQLAAAHFADFSGRPDDPRKYRVPSAEFHGVLHLRSDGSYALVPYDVTEDTFAAFLAAKRLWEWVRGSKNVVGLPMKPQEVAA